MGIKQKVELVKKYIDEIKSKALLTQLQYQIIIRHLENHIEDYCKFNKIQLDELTDDFKRNIHTNVNNQLKHLILKKYGVYRIKDLI